MANGYLSFSVFQSNEEYRSILKSEPCILESWGFGTLDYDGEWDELLKRQLWGCILGCKDGSIYIFHPDLNQGKQKTTMTLRRFSVDRPPPNVPYRRAHLSLSRSRNASPSASQTNIIASTSKSRAVSGLNKEQVEAPKNYVDFEEEQEKMKGLVADKSIKDPKDRSPRASPGPLPARRMDDSVTLASLDSLPPSPLASPPLSPTHISQNVQFSKHLCMKARIIPQSFGYNHSIVSIYMIGNNELFLILQESGTLSLFKTRDGACITSVEPDVSHVLLKSEPAALSARPQNMWTWKSVQVLPLSDSLLVFVMGNARPQAFALASGETENKARVIIYELSGTHDESCVPVLTKIGDFTVDNGVEGISIWKGMDRGIELYQVQASGQILMRTITILPPAAVPFLRRRSHSLSSVGVVSLTQPLWNMVSRFEEQSATTKHIAFPLRIEMQVDVALGTIPLSRRVEGLKLRRVGKALRIFAWTAEELVVFALCESKVDVLCIISLKERARDVHWIDDSVIRLVYSTGITTYNVEPSSAPNTGETTSERNCPTLMTPLVSLVISRRELISACNDSPNRLLSLTSCKDCQNVSILLPVSSEKNLNPRSATRKVLWSTMLPAPQSEKPRITSLLPFGLATVIVGYSSGHVRKVALRELFSSGIYAPSSATEVADLSILSLFSVKDTATEQNYVVGGGDDGSVLFWNFQTLELLSRRVIFVEPLIQVIQPPDDHNERLRGYCLCVSADGTLAVFSMNDFDCLYLVPGAPSPLRTLCLCKDNLMLIYADGRARLWNDKMEEFRWSMSAEKASEMLTLDDWYIATIQYGYSTIMKNSVAPVNKSLAGGDPPPAILFDISSLIEIFARGLLSTESTMVESRQLLLLLAVLHTRGLDDQVDRLLSEMCPEVSSVHTTIGNFDTLANYQLFYGNSPQAPWQISPDYTAGRLLAIVSILRVLLSIGGFESIVNPTLAFYSSLLPNAVGVQYQAPSLVPLSRIWTESVVPDVRQAAKLLLNTEIARLSDDEIISIADIWRHRLPYLVPDSEKQLSKSALSLALCGNIAIERYSVFATTVLADIAKSITLYLYDDTSPYRALAIDLCSRGFEIWQQYFDAMEALRSLFNLATTSSKESIHIHNPGPQARMAVLQIASGNSPLFMTTLSLDILHPRSIEHSRSVMLIIAFLIKKKPMVLYPNLPRLMEAVVKSLDPSNGDREAVHDSVTELVAAVVQAFPTVDFHVASQRLAVGTSEGAVIMYDLKTATRLYVLEGHRLRLTGVSFSPDGRRLLTLSTEEGVFLVWKVGSSFSSLFHPGAPPRQGRSGSESYKTVNFKLADEAPTSMEQMMKEVHFEWLAERTIKVQIRSVTYTVSAS